MDSRGWDSLHRRVSLYWLVLLGGPVALGIAGVLLASVTDSSTPIKVLCILWGLCCAGVSLNLIALLCPRCGKLFFWGHPLFGPSILCAFREKCANCGAQKVAASLQPSKASFDKGLTSGAGPDSRDTGNDGLL